MLTGWAILLFSGAYLGVLFAIAYYGDKRADQGRSLIANPYIYALSIAVYCTSWTFYGSVGRAASSGLGFLPIYLGPTLVFILGWVVLRKIIRISKNYRITSIADFIAARYGKNPLLAGLVSVIAFIGTVPYISLQLEAVSDSYTILQQYPETVAPESNGSVPILADTSLYVALLMAAFAILFGTRHIDASEHHEGMVAAIAFESVVKLVAFMAVGLFVVFGLYDGLGDLFTTALAEQRLANLMSMDAAGGYLSWMSLTVLAMAAIICLPRQFQVTVVENVDEQHMRTAMWLFPLYLLLINIFVLPIALGGLMLFPDGNVDADTFVLTIPMAERQEALAALVFIGGLSAATGMIIVASIAISTMVCNDLVMPMLFRFGRLHLSERQDLTGLLLAIRRCAIVVTLLLGFAYVRLVGDAYALVSIGLVSFAAAAQFVPAMIGGLYWKGANLAGALSGLSGGFLVWAYTLLLPSFAQAGWLPQSWLEHGLFGMELLRPYALFGLDGTGDPVSHALFWTMLVNVGLFVGVSLLTRQGMLERGQAVRFVDAYSGAATGERLWRGKAKTADLQDLVARFVGPNRMHGAFARYTRQHGIPLAPDAPADADLVIFAEKLLSGAIGAASARIMVATVVREEMSDLDQVMEILDEASQVIEYSRQLEQKSTELEVATMELRAANERLKELDKLKDDFVSTVSHELRTPLTSIRSFSEIVHDNPDMEPEQRQHFLNIVIQESERLTRLINDILDLSKLEAGKLEWDVQIVDPKTVVEQALTATSGLIDARGSVRLESDLPESLPSVAVDPDRMTQVLVNLISNALKFSDPDAGHVRVEARAEFGNIRVSVCDNGRGIPRKDQSKIFNRFQQVAEDPAEKPKGTGLGLSICAEIVHHFGGEIWVESELGKGSTFSFTLPAAF